MTPDPAGNEFVVRSLHPGVSREQICENIGWPIRFAETVEETRPPTRLELEALRELNARTATAHGVAASD
jgi:glutaconate CoA-transferase subunit B